MSESPAPKVHITGASCTGVTTLGRALAESLGVSHLDTDAYYWRPTDPPYTSKRPAAERLRLLAEAQGAGGWVLSGSLYGWGDSAIEAADLIVFLTAPTGLRLARLKARERARYGARIEAGGDMEQIHRSFVTWAAQYDDPHFTGRSRLRHEVWLEEQTIPVIRLDGTEPVAALAAVTLAALGRNPSPGAAESAMRGA